MTEEVGSLQLWLLNLLAFMLQMDIVTFSNAALDLPTEPPPAGPPPPEGLALELLSHILTLMRETLTAYRGAPPEHPPLGDGPVPPPAVSAPPPPRARTRRRKGRGAATKDAVPQGTQGSAERGVISGLPRTGGAQGESAEASEGGAGDAVRATREAGPSSTSDGQWEADATQVLGDWLVKYVEDAEWRLDLLRRMTPSSPLGSTGQASNWGCATSSPRRGSIPTVQKMQQVQLLFHSSLARSPFGWDCLP